MISKMGSFTDFAAISSRRRKTHEELRKGMSSREYVIAAYGGGAGDIWGVGNLDLGERGSELNNQIELSCGLWGIKCNFAWVWGSRRLENE